MTRPDPAPRPHSLAPMKEIMDKPVTAQVDAVRWQTTVLGCLVPLLTFAVVLFGLAALWPDLAADLAPEHPATREARFFKSLTSHKGLQWQGVSIPYAALALYLAWELARSAWRWADVIAIRATPEGLVPHRSTGQRPQPWSEIAEVSFRSVKRGWARVPTLFIRLQDGTVRQIRGVCNEEGQAERFARDCRERLERGGLPP